MARMPAADAKGENFEALKTIALKWSGATHPHPACSGFFQPPAETRLTSSTAALYMADQQANAEVCPKLANAIARELGRKCRALYGFSRRAALQIAWPAALHRAYPTFYDIYSCGRRPNPRPGLAANGERARLRTARHEFPAHLQRRRNLRELRAIWCLRVRGPAPLHRLLRHARRVLCGHECGRIAGMSLGCAHRRKRTHALRVS